MVVHHVASLSLSLRLSAPDQGLYSDVCRHPPKYVADHAGSFSVSLRISATELVPVEPPPHPPGLSFDQADAFLLFAERIHPYLFAAGGGACTGDDDAPSPIDQTRLLTSTTPSTAAINSNIGRAVVRRYRSEAETWAMTRRRDVPSWVLEDLLALWRRGGGLTPAEYGALAFAPSQVRGSFC